MSTPAPTPATPPDSGGIGVSSERVPDDPTSVEGTGSRGTSVDTADGLLPPAQPGSPSADAGEQPVHSHG